MRHTCKICSPYVPGLSGEAGRLSSDEAASRERVGNLRIAPMRSGPGRARGLGAGRSQSSRSGRDYFCDRNSRSNNAQRGVHLTKQTGLRVHYGI